MPQHDYSIADASGTAFLADLNNALAAIVSNNSGAAAPSTTYAYQLWADTGSTPPTLRQRNAANNAWVIIGPIDQAAYGMAPLASPALTGTPTAPTAPAGTSTVQLATTAFVAAALDLVIPAGIVVEVSGNVAPAGYVKANGGTYNRVAQPRLWAWAQASGNLAASEGAKTKGQYGPGNGTTTFSIPDLRGWFVRAWDDGAGIDSGRGIGTEQASQVEAHTHSLPPVISSPGSGSTPGLVVGFFSSAQGTGSFGGTETRPRNVALLYCIKT